MSRRYLIRDAIMIACLVGHGVSCTTGPAATEDEEMPAYLDPAGGEIKVYFQEGDVVIGSVVYKGSVCGLPVAWYPQDLPPGDPVLLDLHFAYTPTVAPTRDGPPPAPDSFVPVLKPEFVQDVVELGGEIVREFNLAVVRARVPRSSFSRFEDFQNINHARSVPDPERFDVGVLIMYESEREPEVKQQFQQLGGVIRNEYSRIPAIRGVLPDVAIPELLEPGAISWVSISPGYYGCLAG